MGIRSLAAQRAARCEASQDADCHGRLRLPRNDTGDRAVYNKTASPPSCKNPHPEGWGFFSRLRFALFQSQGDGGQVADLCGAPVLSINNRSTKPTVLRSTIRYIGIYSVGLIHSPVSASFCKTSSYPPPERLKYISVSSSSKSSSNSLFAPNELLRPPKVE